MNFSRLFSDWLSGVFPEPNSGKSGCFPHRQPAVSISCSSLMLFMGRMTENVDPLPASLFT
ncbi:MAG: hypothetical protein P4L42_13255, partial [Desulfocapsaceae bacterium]|nr:hypothetical protein [Desulfocapsaceae bacterium]